MINIIEGNTIQCVKIEQKFLGQMTLWNSSLQNVAFKFKTNHTGEVSIQPFMGVLPAQQQKTFNIVCNTYLHDAKILIQTIECQNPNADLKSVFASRSVQSMNVILLLIDQSLNQSSFYKNGATERSDLQPQETSIRYTPLNYNLEKIEKLEAELLELQQQEQQMRNTLIALRQKQPERIQQVSQQSVVFMAVFFFFFGYIFTR